ncbi:hypothetical protein N7495_005985 [Penicillium taxi]|uniref:uncharacterized protein n=1 Tax=Penicillium taxi TaxID=168475 RepID=UPI002545718B|nr:uncharacterized protein N7495_005985 [Penicillium taxi]KAJ5894294.1 hypothetical protein N7495_005985 [Penicillium taxi]
MSRPLKLDVPKVQDGNQDQRYSFMETPVEMHPSSRYQLYTSSPPPLPTSQQPVYEQSTEVVQHPTQYAQGNIQQSAQYTQQVHPDQYAYQAPYQAPYQGEYIPSEKERQLQREGIISSYSEYPSLDQHPANYAPFADQIDCPHSTTIQSPQSTIHPPYHSNETDPQPPNSPGPLPTKTNPEPLNQNDTVTVAPDANPLQSPKLPYFPPPTAAKHGPLEDLGSFHQPGQIIHPNQEVQGGTWYNGLCDFSRIGIWLFATIQHTRTRKAYGIHGDVASDCVRATCCTCCTLIQDEKEIIKREQKRSRAALERGTTLISPYTAPGPMTFAPPSNN